MLNLDAIAEKKATQLNQEKELWRQAVWSAEFQKFSADLTDGEVESIVGWCPTARHLRALVSFLEEKVKETGVGPYKNLIKLAEDEKVRPDQWIQDHLPKQTAL
ncbi:MAG: hypothetical protein AB7F86_12925 [Bdellovibrionales bacterium]